MAHIYKIPQNNVKSVISLTDAEAWADLFGMEPATKLSAPAAWSAVGYVNRCVDLRAGAVSALPWVVSRGDTEIATSDDIGALPWLNNVTKMLYLTEAALAIGGQAYWYKLRNRRKEPIELRWFAPGTMTPIWTPAGLAHFERKLNNQTIHIPADDIAYFRQSNPMHETEPGPSPVSVALADANVIHNLNTFAADFFERGAIRATMLTVEGGIPAEADKEKLKSAWQRALHGLKNAFSVEVFSSSVKPVSIGDGVGDLNNAEITSEKREAISAALGVPHSLVVSNAANFATAQADRLNMYDFTIIPQADHIASVLNRYLFDPLGLDFKFQPDTLPIYQTDESDRAATFGAYVLGGIMPSIAAQIVGVRLPEGIEYADLDPEPTPLTIDVTPVSRPALDDSGEDEQDDAEDKAVELRRFRTWAGKRANADPAKFRSDILTDEDKAGALAEIKAGDADSDDAPFPVAEWESYP